MIRSLLRRDPTVNLSPFSEVDRFFDDLFSSFTTPMSTLNIPSVDIYREDDRNMVVELHVPGFDREDMQISVNNGVLEIRGERTEKEEHKGKKRSYMVRENSLSFARRIVLPEGADSEHINAALDKGVLTVTVPVERHEAKRVEIGAP